MPSEPVFKLNALIQNPLKKKLVGLLGTPIERVLAFHRLNGIYDELRSDDDPRDFLTRSLERLQIRYEVAPEDLERLPKEGGAIAVANHPFGVVEGMILAHLGRRVRPDVKCMASYLLGRVPEARGYLIEVDPYGTPAARAFNARPLKQAIQWVQTGGLLGVFPAGGVASLDVRRRRIVEPEWSTGVARLIRRAQAPVVPVFFSGANGPLFQLAGLVHPRIQTALLPRELLNKGRRVIHLRVGRPIPWERLREFDSDALLMSYLRQRTYLLGEHQRPRPRLWRGFSPAHPHRAATVPVIAPIPPELLAEDVARLEPDQVLCEAGEFTVFCASAAQLPHVLEEIGRLRELTFRAADEGTGRAVDLDEYDGHYLHLVAWNRETREVVGAYRMGRTDQILPTRGVQGLYTHTLFDYDPALFDRLGPALELGRSFVRLEYQRNYSPLMLLWKGIGQYVLRHPECKVFIGPVSISRGYRPLSRRLIVEFLRGREVSPLARYVTPRNPPRLRGVSEADPSALACWVRDIDELSQIVADMDPAQGGVPILLKQYLKLGGKWLGCNVDPAFSHVLDMLLMVDLASTEPRIMERYMGKAEAARFMARHGIAPARSIRPPERRIA
jgi:putative hemolysin